MWVEELPNGKFKFVERYTDPMTDKTKKVSVCLDKNTAATRKLAMAELERKINAICSNVDCSNFTFSYLADKYIEHQQKNVKMSTYRRDKLHAEKFIDIIGKDTLLSKLTARYIREKFDKLDKSNTTKNEYLKHLKAMLSWGYKNDYIEDVSWLVKLDKYPDTPKKEKIQDKYLEDNEVSILLDAMSKSKCVIWYDFTRFLLLTGLRIGEAIALEKNDISAEYIHICKTYDTNNNLVTSPKTFDSTRDIYIQPELKVLIKEINAHNKLNRVTGKLFFSDEGAFIQYDAYRKFLKEYTQKHLGRTITPHALRHTHASMLMTRGMSIDAISRRLGHADSDITKQIYLHVMEKLKEQDNENMKKISLF